MDVNFIRTRISELRVKKNISEYKMSLDLGHSKSYIQSISSGKALPSLSEFLYICDYFGVTPKEFFDTSNTNPLSVSELYRLSRNMSEEDLELLITVAKRLQHTSQTGSA